MCSVNLTHTGATALQGAGNQGVHQPQVPIQYSCSGKCLRMIALLVWMLARSSLLSHVSPGGCVHDVGYVCK